MSSDDNKKPWDAALDSVRGSVDDALKSVQGGVDSNLQNLKGLANEQIGQAQELTASARLAIRRLGGEAVKGIKEVVRPVVQVFEQAGSQEGTELRKQIAQTREVVNHQLYDVQLKLEETSKAADEQLAPVKTVLAEAKIQAIKVNNFRKEHPEAALAGLAVVVGAPSLLLRGKVAAARNVLVAVGAGAGAAYTVDTLTEKKARK